MRLYLSFGQGVRLLFIALRKGAGTAHNKKDRDAIVQLAYVIASPSFLFKLEA